MVPTWNTKGKTSKFVDVEGYNRESGIDDLEWVERGCVKKKYKTLGTERCENIMNLYINKI